MADPRLLAGELEQQRPETRRARDRGNTSEAPDAVGALEWGPLVGGMDIVNRYVTPLHTVTSCTAARVRPPRSMAPPTAARVLGRWCERRRRNQ